MRTLLAKNAEVLVTMDSRRRELKNAGTVIDGKVMVKDCEIVTMDIWPVVATHNRCAALLAEGWRSRQDSVVSGRAAIARRWRRSVVCGGIEADGESASAAVLRPPHKGLACGA